ncbi:MAG TPA: zinc-dependent metalloprotease family protein [Flavobacterium sp.]|nr:zinc-dependent metalloprotease family protein [Flavobacterium sp.]
MNELVNTRAIDENIFTRLHHPEQYHLFQFDHKQLLETVKDAPEFSKEPSNVILNLPDVNGKIASFWIYDNPVMESELALEVSNIRSLKAVAVENSTISLSISLSDIFGFHAMGIKNDGSVYYIDNFTNDLNTVVVYNRSDLETPKNNFQCLTAQNQMFENSILNQTTLSIDNKKRTFRLAVACTTEYANYHIANAPANVPKTTIKQQKNIVLAAINVTLTRINQIFERELNVHLNLVANNRDILFITSDNFNNGNAQILIGQSQSVINSVIGSANYDIGHTFSTGAGGLASLGSVCSTWGKAQGVTGSSAPIGDPYDVDYVAHEMGHQFGANHTFNNACQFNRNDATAMEPGSGSTIMSYAGICTPNIQMKVDAFYHYISIKEMQTFLQTASCAQQTTITNNAPVVPALQVKTIPYGTPFILSTNATDGDGDQLTYTFEQSNTQIATQPPAANSSTGPAFRSIAPNTQNYRSFPNESTVLAGTTNSNGIVSNDWERLANRARTYSFVATVRDNNPAGGRAVYTQPVLITAANTGPFVITYPNNNPTTTEPVWHTGTSKTITWNVAGTTANNINTSHVNILISTDNGATYTYLISNTPNDGSETVTIPTTLNNTYQGRIKIEAVGNIFYTVSKKLTIWDPNVSTDSFELANLNVYPNPVKNVLNIRFSSEHSGKTKYDIFNLNGRLVQSFERESSTENNYQIDVQHLASGTYILIINNEGYTANRKFIKQ